MSNTNQSNEVHNGIDCPGCELALPMTDPRHKRATEVRVCMRGVDGSPGCGHSKTYFRVNEDPRVIASGELEPRCWEEDEDGFCGHRCDFSVHVPDEKHEFVEQPRGKFPKPENADGKCWEVVNMIYCGQPRAAACHAVEPPHDTDCCVSDVDGPRHSSCGGWCVYCIACCAPHIETYTAKHPHLSLPLHKPVSSTQPDAAKDSAEVRHLLQCLAEECAEVIQAVSKALRFGLDDDHQASNPDIVSPRLYIVRELADLDAVYLMLAEREVLPDIDDRHRQAKVEKLTKMMDYAHEKGML